MYGQNPYSQYPYTGYVYPNYGNRQFAQPQQPQMAQPQTQMQQPMQPTMPTLCYAKMEEALTDYANKLGKPVTDSGETTPDNLPSGEVYGSDEQIDFDVSDYL